MTHQKNPIQARLFLTVLLLLILAMVGPRLANTTARSESAYITIRAEETLAPITPLLFGQNYGAWTNTSDTYVDLYQGVGAMLLRFPAGNWGLTQVAVESSDEPGLPTFSSLRDDGALNILVVNKNPKARKATLTIEGFRPSGSAQVWLHDGTQPVAQELSPIAIAETFPHTFPAYSTTLLILEPAPRSNWPLWAVLGLVGLVLTAVSILIERRARKLS